MTKFLLPTAAAFAAFCALTGCDKSTANDSPTEHIDADEKVVAARLRPATDPVQDTISRFLLGTRQAYNNRRFDDLEAQAAQLRASKERFGDGSWKISQFYQALDCRREEPESMWLLHDRIHQDWITAKPSSITARTAYARFLTDYAWHARGSGYADTVTPEGGALFEKRLAAAHKILTEARSLPEKDPVWWFTAQRVGLGEGFTKWQFEDLVAEAVKFEPKFWRYDTARAYSLLPRWYGQSGDWEAYAAQASARPGGPGPESYARIVIDLRGFYDNIFRETHASWPTVRAGLEQMRGDYPDSLEILSESADLATLAEDRLLAKAMFDQLGDRYLPVVWRKPERFAHYRHWAQTGNW